MKNFNSVLKPKWICLVTVLFIFYLNYRKNVLYISNFEKTLVLERETCGRYPTEEDLIVNNLVWQVLMISKGIVNILNAYLDLRQNKTVVRINVNSVLLNESDTFYCQFWFDNSSRPTITEATEVLLIWRRSNTFFHQR